MSASISAATDSAPAGSAMMPSFWYRSSIAVHTAPSSTVVIDTMSPAAASAAYGQRARPVHRGAVDELVDVIQRDGLPRGQRGDHRCGPGRLDAQHRSARRPLGQIGRDACDAAAATDRHDHQIRLAVELVENLGGDGALTGHRARIVVRRHQRRAGPRDVIERRGSGLVVRLADGDQLDEVPSVVADAVALLLRRLGGHVHPAMDAHRPARHREALRVVARRRAHHARGDLVVGQLHQQVVRAAQLVRPDRLQVLALQVDRRAGGLRQPLAELQRAARRPRRKFAERPHRCRPRTAATCEGSGSVQRTPVNGATNQRFSVNRGQHENRDLPVRLRLVLGVVRPRLDRTLPPGGLLVAERPRAPRSPWSPRRPAARPAGGP